MLTSSECTSVIVIVSLPESVSIKMSEYEHECQYEFDYESKWQYEFEYKRERKYEFVSTFSL